MFTEKHVLSTDKEYFIYIICSKNKSQWMWLDMIINNQWNSNFKTREEREFDWND